MRPTEFVSIPEEIRKKKKLSILMPYLNEEKIIVKNVQETIRIMEELDFNYEIVLVDDGSKDDSYELLSKEFKRNKKVKLVRNFQNFGKGWALKTGYEFSTGDFILFLDSDLELSPYHIPNFFRIMLEGNSDAVIGSKLHKESRLEYPWKRRVVSFFYYSIIKIFFGLPIMDSQTGIKLFRREALELSLPKVLVKKFAFDIELLIILHKQKMKILPAPIELNFSRGRFGNIKWKAIVNTFTDTLAVLYRDKILRFYDRPMGQNIQYFYSIILFSDNFDDYERKCLERFLNINYEKYQVILAGKTDPANQDNRLTFIRCEEVLYSQRLEKILKKNVIRGDYAVFSRLNAYPDERFLYNTGRILSLQGVAGAGGFITLRNEPEAFETIALSVLSSFFLNLNLVYCYRPMNYKEVAETQLNGLFIRRDFLENINFKDVYGLKLEYILSKQIHKNGEKLVYSPDIMLYERFPLTPGELFRHIWKKSNFRAMQFRSPVYKSLEKLSDKKFYLSIGLLSLFGILIALTAVSANLLFLSFIILYYLMLFLSRIFLFGWKKGLPSFLYLSAAQILYGLFFLLGLIRPNKKKSPRTA